MLEALDASDDPDAEDEGDGEPSLGSAEVHPSPYLTQLESRGGLNQEN
jgi:hypothetical protein